MKPKVPSFVTLGLILSGLAFLGLTLLKLFVASKLSAIPLVGGALSSVYSVITTVIIGIAKFVFKMFAIAWIVFFILGFIIKIIKKFASKHSSSVAGAVATTASATIPVAAPVIQTAKVASGGLSKMKAFFTK